METLTCLVDEYHSADAGNENRAIDVHRGEHFDVSTEKAEQMLSDFPDWFAEGVVEVTPDQDSPKAADGPNARWPRPDLNAYAANLGIQEPEGFSNKAALVEAINEAIAAATPAAQPSGE